MGGEETVEDLAEVAVKAILRGAADTLYNRRLEAERASNKYQEYLN